MIKNIPIQVAVKIKPSQNKSCLTYTSSVKNCELKVSINPKLNQFQSFQIDAIHDANTSQKSIFVDCRLHTQLEKFIQGYNVTIMAYGHTGAGKTYTMEGNQQTQQKGIIEETFHFLQKHMDLKNISANCSYVQLYNQKLYDLFIDDGNLDKPLKLKWQSGKEFFIQNCQWKQCRSVQELIKVWKSGVKNRIISSNRIHQLSSRSHALFTIQIEDKDEDDNYRSRQLVFVDLAGSEKIFSTNDRLSKQSIQINKSLFVLRKVIKALQQLNSQQKQVHIPYRDSKLTSLLKKAIGGNCVTLIIACIDGQQSNIQQTLATLKYAVSARRINNHATIQIDSRAQQLKYLRQLNKKMQKDLQIATKQVSLFQKLYKDAQGKKQQNNEYSLKIIECIGTVRQLLQSNKQLRQQLTVCKDVCKKQENQIKQLVKQTKRKKYMQTEESEDKYQKTSLQSPNNKKQLPNYASSISIQRFKTQVRIKNSIKRRKEFTVINPRHVSIEKRQKSMQ